MRLKVAPRSAVVEGMTTTDGAPVPRSRVLPGLDRRSALVLAMTVALAALTVLVGLPFVSAPAVADVVRLPWWLLAAGFAATEACVLHIQIRREAQTVSVS